MEADDCIALCVKHLIKTCPNVEITIITSDKDYLQLVGPRVRIFDLMFKNLSEQKSSLGDAEKNLFCKIVMGDVSDNISSVLTKCGPKTAIKCFENRSYFEERLKKENAYAKYENNMKIIDFDCGDNCSSGLVWCTSGLPLWIRVIHLSVAACFHFSLSFCIS